MADQITLVAERRDERGTRPARRARRAGRLPGVVYGLGKDAVAVTIDRNEMVKLLHRAGHNALINLEVEGEGAGQLTLAREIQRHPVRGDLVHVDFVRIRADLPVDASVPVRLEGDPVGLKEGGVLEHVLFEVAIRAKPADIPQQFELDVSALSVGENLRATDLTLPAGVELVTDPDAVVANVVAPRVAEEASLTPEQLAELEGLTEEELDALKAFAQAAPAEAEGEGAEGVEEGGESGEEGGGAADEG
jgi:large subunit ribosomal protein L25